MGQLEAYFSCFFDEYNFPLIARQVYLSEVLEYGLGTESWPTYSGWSIVLLDLTNLYKDCDQMKNTIDWNCILRNDKKKIVFKSKIRLLVLPVNSYSRCSVCGFTVSAPEFVPCSGSLWFWSNRLKWWRCAILLIFHLYILQILFGDIIQTRNKSETTYLR